MLSIEDTAQESALQLVFEIKITKNNMIVLPIMFHSIKSDFQMLELKYQTTMQMFIFQIQTFHPVH